MHAPPLKQLSLWLLTVLHRLQCACKARVRIRFCRPRRTTLRQRRFFRPSRWPLVWLSTLGRPPSPRGQVAALQPCNHITQQQTQHSHTTFPLNTKHFYTICTMLGRRCINVIQMFGVCLIIWLWYLMYNEHT